uniref:Uncharacterized protein n=1 Tax=Panagrolaimus superbus TaxID=310955 RepID=A0A914Y3I9_9BILA
MILHSFFCVTFSLSILNFCFAIPFNPSLSSNSKDFSSSDDHHLSKPSNVAFIVGNYKFAKRVTTATTFAPPKSTPTSTTTLSPIRSGSGIGKVTGRTASKIEIESSTKPSLDVIGFQQSFNEPQPVNFGFLPVFDRWPKHLTKTVKQINLFPERGNNEWFAPPRADPRLSQFPAPTAPKLANTLNINSANKPFHQTSFNRPKVAFPMSPTTTATPSTTTTTRRSTSTTQRPKTTTISRSTIDINHVWNFAPITRSPFDAHDFQLDFGPPSTTTTSTPVIPKKSKSSPPGIAPPDWNGGFHESNKKARDMPSSKIFSSKSKSDIRKISIHKKEFNKIQKFNSCRTLNPAVDSYLHPKTDRSCEQTLPNFNNDGRCRCRYIVAFRDFAGCAVKFYSLCFRI